ncbi:hypothetical protein [Slackia isoflavoniconvertens]|uniref:Uncharacterized protein n=1 Tax=Slackia isoflavoniconvertens TaxID=572010 RepID=A0A369LK65_9ACTN|nr:hypothetical protein [Slackia isoflavoniconvertens]RDB58428.1 hypothetical protein C1881_05890 [Slackia isoflavoniconvertens]
MDRRAYSQENRNQRADSAANTVVISPKAEAETPNPTGIKGLFEGLSVSQVTAGALAAVTSMLLSAQIGIAGSVIGVAVGSVVSTVSSQLYKKFLAGSAEKLRGFASSDNEEENAAANTVAAQNATQSFAHAQTTVMPITRVPFESAETSVLSAGQIVGADAHDMRGSQAAQGAQSNTPRINSAAGHTGNASHATGVVEIEAQKQKTMQRRVLAVSVASSLAAILLFAGLVLMFTGGEGIGTKVAPFTGEVVTSQLADENSAATSNDTEKTHDAKKAETTVQNENEKNSTPQSPQQNSTQSASNSSSTTESSTNSSNTDSGSENSSSASGNNSPSSSGSGSGQTSSNNTNSNSNNANSSGSGSTDSGENATNSGSTGSESSASSQAGSGK